MDLVEGWGAVAVWADGVVGGVYVFPMFWVANSSDDFTFLVIPSIY